MKITKKTVKERIRQLKWMHDEFLKKIKPEVVESMAFQRGLIIGFAQGRIKSYKEILKRGR